MEFQIRANQFHRRESGEYGYRLPFSQLPTGSARFLGHENILEKGIGCGVQALMLRFWLDMPFKPGQSTSIPRRADILLSRYYSRASQLIQINTRWSESLYCRENWRDHT